jgi:hypothetical protein
MSGERKKATDLEAASHVLRLVTEGMDVLHGHGTTPEAAANLALAQQQLREFVGLEKSKIPKADRPVLE